MGIAEEIKEFEALDDRFKFRAWNIIVERFQYFDFHDLAKMNHDDIQWHILNFQQCTGIKDRNGRLIYEGDIVERDNGFNKKRGVVRFDKPFLQFVATNMSIFSLVNRSVVIGNIYENEDLLKEVENEQI